jgi:hypothetical protein
VRRMNPVYDAAYYEDLAGRLYGRRPATVSI